MKDNNRRKVTSITQAIIFSPLVGAIWILPRLIDSTHFPRPFYQIAWLYIAPILLTSTVLAIVIKIWKHGNN